MRGLADPRHLALALALSIAPAGSALGAFTFEKIVDTSTPVPGGGSAFTIFWSVALDSGDVVFLADTTTGRGIYTTSGGVLSVVADSSTPMPGGPGNFGSFDNQVGLADGAVAFAGREDPLGLVGFAGIYRWESGWLTKLADDNTLDPITQEPLRIQFVEGADIDAGDVVFANELIPPPFGLEVYGHIGGSVWKLTFQYDGILIGLGLIGYIIAAIVFCRRDLPAPL